MTELTLINTNLRRYTFSNRKFREWVESRSAGKVLNLFAGATILDLDEVRVDTDRSMVADHYTDAFDFVKSWKGDKFDTVILDPPYSYRKSMELYNDNYTSRFKLIADNIDRIMKPEAKIISLGYHSSFMGKNRGYDLVELCVFAHGGAQHCTIGIVEQLKSIQDSKINIKKEAYKRIRGASNIK